MLLLLSIACLNHQPRPTDALDWDLYPELVSGLIHVAPVIVLSELPQAELNDSVGQRLDPCWHRGASSVPKSWPRCPTRFAQPCPGRFTERFPVTGRPTLWTASCPRPSRRTYQTH